MFAYPTLADAAAATSALVGYFQGHTALTDAVRAGWIVQGFAQSQVIPSTAAMTEAKRACATATKAAKAQFFETQARKLQAGDVNSIPWSTILAEVLALLELFLHPPAPVPNP